MAKAVINRGIAPAAPKVRFPVEHYNALCGVTLVIAGHKADGPGYYGYVRYSSGSVRNTAYDGSGFNAHLGYSFPIEKLNPPAPKAPVVGVTLELSVEEAAALAMLTCTCGGHPDTTARGYTDAVLKALAVAGIHGYQLNSRRDFTGAGSNYWSTASKSTVATEAARVKAA